MAPLVHLFPLAASTVLYMCFLCFRTMFFGRQSCNFAHNHPWDDCIFTYLNGGCLWFSCRKNVGNYTSPMDPYGLVEIDLASKPSKRWASVLIRKDSDGEALVDNLCCYRRGVWRFFWKEVLAFPGSFKQTNNVFHGKLSGCHMDEEPTKSLL